MSNQTPLSPLPMNRTSNINWKDAGVLNVCRMAVTASPDNLKKAFEVIAGALNTSASNVSAKWYGTGGNGIRNIIGNQFNISSSHINLSNAKNSPRKADLVTGELVKEMVLSCDTYPGMKVITTRQYYAIES